MFIFLVLATVYANVVILSSSADFVNTTPNKHHQYYLQQERQTVYYDDGWKVYQVTQPPSMSYHHLLIPITLCMDNSHGLGGAVEFTYEIEVLAGTSLGASLSVPLGVTLGVELGVGFSLAYSYSSTMSCEVGKGEYGQLFMQPLLIEVPESSLSTVRWDKHRQMIRGETTTFESFRVLSRHMPNVFCVSDTTPLALKCNAVIVPLVVD